MRDKIKRVFVFYLTEQNIHKQKEKYMNSFQLKASQTHTRLISVNYILPLFVLMG